MDLSDLCLRIHGVPTLPHWAWFLRRPLMKQCQTSVLRVLSCRSRFADSSIWGLREMHLFRHLLNSRWLPLSEDLSPRISLVLSVWWTWLHIKVTTLVRVGISFLNVFRGLKKWLIWAVGKLKIATFSMLTEFLIKIWYQVELRNNQKSQIWLPTVKWSFNQSRSSKLTRFSKIVWTWTKMPLSTLLMVYASTQKLNSETRTTLGSSPYKR